MFCRPIILSAFLVFFLHSLCAAQTPARYQSPDSGFDALERSLRTFAASAVDHASASPAFSSRLEEFINEAAFSCPPDYDALLRRSASLAGEIRSARSQYDQLAVARDAAEKALDWAMENGRMESTQKFMNQLDDIEAQLAPIQKTATMLEPDALDEFESLIEKHSEKTCPADMVYIDGAFCMDIYEYPNNEGETPLTGVDFHTAQKKCEAEGKRLCSGEEWMRVCAGHECRPYHPSMRPFDPDDCFADIDYYPGTPAFPSGSTPECDTPEGVSEIFGNAWEWTTETYREDYYIVQGGVHMHARAPLCTNHKWMDPDTSRPYFGFRCCADPAAPPPPPPPEEESSAAEGEPGAETSSQATQAETATSPPPAPDSSGE